MILRKLTAFPQPEIEPCSDWVVSSPNKDEPELNYIVYAAKRDFLSTPRTYSVVEIIGKNINVEFEVNRFERSDYFEQLENDIDEASSEALLDGIYLKTAVNQPADCVIGNVILVLIIDGQVLEFQCQQYRLAETVYYSLDAKSALLEFLQEN